MKRGSGSCAVDINCTAALTSLSDSVSYITFLFSEWRIHSFYISWFWVNPLPTEMKRRIGKRAFSISHLGLMLISHETDQLFKYWFKDDKQSSYFNPIRPGGGGGSEARMTKLTAANQKPLTLRCPNFVTFSFYLLDMFWPNFSKIDQSGGCCCSFLIEISQKFTKWKIFLHLEIAEIDMGGGSILDREERFWT